MTTLKTAAIAMLAIAIAGTVNLFAQTADCRSFRDCFAAGYASRAPETQIKYYTKALKFWSYSDMFNNKAATYNNRGNAYARLKQYGKAVADYSEILKLNPLDIAAYNNRAVAYKGLEQYDKADADFNKAVWISALTASKPEQILTSEKFLENPEAAVQNLKYSENPDATALLGIILVQSSQPWIQVEAAKTLGKRLDSPIKDLKVLDTLPEGLKDEDGWVRCTVLWELAKFINYNASRLFAPEFIEKEILPKLEAVLNAGSLQDNDLSTRRAAGDLLLAVRHWRNFDSPEALKRKKAYERKERRQEYLFAGIFALTPLAILLGGLVIFLSRGAVAYLLIRPSSSLSGILKHAVQAITKRPSLTCIPILSAAVITALAAGTLYAALHLQGLPPRMSDEEIEYRAMLMMLAPRIVLAYFFAGFCLLFLNSILIRSVVRHSQGLSFGLFKSLSVTVVRIPSILVLSIFSFGLIYVFRVLLYFLRKKFGIRLGFFGAIAEMFVEAGTMLATYYVLVVLMTEGVSLPKALERIRDMLRKKRRGDSLRALSGTAAIRYEAALSVCALPFPFCLALYLVTLPLNKGEDNWLASRFGLPQFYDYQVLLGTGMVLCVLLGSIFFCFLQAVEAVLAAGIYLHDQPEPMLPLEFESGDFDELDQDNEQDRLSSA